MSKSNRLILLVKNVGKTYDDVTILRDVKFSLQRGEKAGLVGQNGIGKSTLLKIIAGKVSCESGGVYIPKGVRIGYMPQEENGEASTSEGERAKALIGNLIALDADLYILDEPTNNLDIHGLFLLEDFVKKSSKTFLIVSHDREFLDRAATKIVEIDEFTRSSHIYDGNFGDYMRARARRIERAWASYNDKAEKARALKKSAEEKAEWTRRLEAKRKGVKKMAMHEREKPVAAVLRDKEGRMARRGRIMRDRLEKAAREAKAEKPRETLPLTIQFEVAERSADKVFELEGITKNMGSLTVGPINISLKYGDKILIVGPNGSGKSTLIKMLSGELEPDAGKVVRGTRVEIGYLPQKETLKSDATILDECRRLFGSDLSLARSLLSRFGLGAHDVKKKIRDLSPGEKSRFILATLMFGKVNCLILDEPSNHLDLEALGELEEALKNFSGTLVVVSHDRYFIHRIGVSDVYMMKNGALRHVGNFTEYEHILRSE